MYQKFTKRDHEFEKEQGDIWKGFDEKGEGVSDTIMS